MRYFIVLGFLSFSFSIFAATSTTPNTNCYCVNYTKEEFFNKNNKLFLKRYLKPKMVSVVKNTTSCNTTVKTGTYSIPVKGGKKVFTSKQVCTLKKAPAPKL